MYNHTQALQELGVVEKEGYMTLSLCIHHHKTLPDPNDEVIRTVLPLKQSVDIDILKYLQDKIYGHDHLPFFKAGFYYKGKLVEIKDNDTFVWACLMRKHEYPGKPLELPINIIITDGFVVKISW